MHTTNRLFTFLLGALLLVSFASAEETRYVPKAQQVVDQVYAIIGPLDQRSELNDGLNNNLGFVIADGGVILIDSGASLLGAQAIERAIAEVTPLPVKWVINTGGQDHRWLGNAYFAEQGAEIIALERTAATQAEYAAQQLESLERFLGERLEGTEAMPASRRLTEEDAALELGGVRLELHYTDAHYPGDAWVWLPAASVIFTGDLVYVDRMLAVLPWSSVIHARQAFQAMEQLKPVSIVPGHGQVTDLAGARRDCGDYYDFLVDNIGAAAQEMESMQDVINRFSELPRFSGLRHYESLHRTNMNRTYLEFEQL